MTATKNCLLAVVLAAALSGNAGAQDKKPAVEPLRGNVPIPATSETGIYRMERHDRVIPRDHAWQPPIIPHNVKGYQITKNVNTCMVCHSSTAAPRTGATPVAKSHYVDRDGKVLQTVSARRYFCLQCHAPQFDAQPLVENTFQSPR